jgi:bacteriophage holin
VKALFANPYLLATAFLAVLGVLTDPTTKGISDEKKNQ